MCMYIYIYIYTWVRHSLNKIVKRHDDYDDYDDDDDDDTGGNGRAYQQFCFNIDYSGLTHFNNSSV